MSFDNKHKALAGALALVTILLALAFYSWLGAHDAQVRAEATVTSQKQAFEQAAAELQTLQDTDRERAAEAATALEAMRAAVARVQTPQQIAQWIPQQLPTPQPITITVPPATAGNPAPPATATIPQADLPALRDFTAQCQQCSVERAAAQADVVSRDQQLKVAGEQLAAVQKERDAYKTAARGTFWSRMKTAAKWIIVGGGIGAAAVCGTGHCK